ncbi:MAG: ABC transporter permease [Deltaproteobacteria bacterium]|jgi:phospholipid/cholesterol/gamma-HCH transport system permease protein|nr:MAG: ABC transporter permease [Deltaproteobacteria bacterium]
MVGFISGIGNFFISMIERIGDVGILLYRTFRLCFSRPLNLDSLIEQVYEIGFKSIPIVVLSAMAIGMVMVVQLAYGFGRFGAKGLVGPVVSLAIVRELGPVLASLLVGGRVGAGITAEIGSMKVTEQIDAIRALGADPIKKLVVPRFIAAVVSFPLLTLIADLAGILGAMIMANVELDITPRLFISSIVGWIIVSDIFSGILKTVFFGLIVSTLGCYIGLNTEGGTQGVGKATTFTVVISLVLIIIGDFILTKLFLVL